MVAGGDATNAGPALVLLAFAAQLAADFASSSVHELLAMGVRPKVHVRIVGQVSAVDAALGAFGLLAAWAAQSLPWAALAPLPVVGLLAAMAADRTRKVATAHDRLRALEHERRRLRSAVQSVGDAFASNLNLDALLRIVTGAALEALDGAAGRAIVVDGGRAVARESFRDAPEALAALAAAERRLLASNDTACVEEGGI